MYRRFALVLASMLTLGGCTPAAPDPDATRAGQEAACAAVTADHVGRDLSEVTATWSAGTEAGTAIVEVRDDGRLHSCEVDAELNVVALEHPVE